MTLVTGDDIQVKCFGVDITEFVVEVDISQGLAKEGWARVRVCKEGRFRDFNQGLEVTCLYMGESCTLFKAPVFVQRISPYLLPYILLEKYMEHVDNCEGITFVDRLNDPTASEIEFSEIEVAALKLIDYHLAFKRWLQK